MEPDWKLPTTCWPDVIAADQTDSDLRQDALDELLSHYLPPLKNHLLRKFGVDEAKAEDWLQSFCLEKVLLKRILGLAQRERGHFRTFLLNALDNFVLSQLRNENALKRQPKQPHLPWHEVDETVCLTIYPEPGREFDLDWARQVLQNALDEMYSLCEQTGQKAIWGVFEGRLLQDLAGDIPPSSYDEITATYGFASPQQAMNALHSAKRMFHRVLRTVVAEYLQDDQQIDRELGEIKRILLNARSS